MYDGPTRRAPVLGQFCGEHGPVNFFSSGEHLYIEFITRTGRMGLANDPYDSSVDYKFNRRGFNMSFSFRQDLVNMGQQVFVIDNFYISVSIALLTVTVVLKILHRPHCMILLKTFYDEKFREG